MKKITYNEDVFYYKIKEFEHGPYDVYSSFKTEFYKLKGFKKNKKYWVFGPIIKSPKYEFVFSIDLNIESANNTKEEIRKCVDDELIKVNRKKEIKNGEIL